MLTDPNALGAVVIRVERWNPSDLESAGYVALTLRLEDGNEIVLKARLTAKQATLDEPAIYEEQR